MEIRKDIHALKIPFQVPIAPDKKVDRFVNVYLIYADKVWLIDTGVASSEVVIFDYLKKTGKQPTDIAGVVFTHSHPDHIGAAKNVHEASRCLMAAHGAEKNWIEDVDLQARERPVPGFHTLVQGSVKIDCVLAEGERLDLGNDFRLEVIHTPGHSKGSISLLLPDQGILLSGDAVPVQNEMPVYDDAATSIRSIEKLKAVAKLQILLSSWDVPRHGVEAQESLNRALQYLERIHKAVMKTAGPGNNDPMTLCGHVLQELGLPAAMANPLVAKSLYSHLSAAGI